MGTEAAPHNADSARPVDPRIGTVLQGRYRLLERIAAGGMGVVYRGERVGLERPVAVKFLHANFAADEASMKRFEREALAMGKLSHPNCVSVIDIGVDDDRSAYIVMDYVHGRSLHSVLREGRVSKERALHIVSQILAALAHAHGQGMVHRDIKPANIMLTEVEGNRDHVFMLDFGLAKLRRSTRNNDITASHVVVGTPSYMSPEQGRAEKVDEPSDVYSTGVLLFELLTGTKLYDSDNPIETLQKHQNAPIPRLRDRAPDEAFSDALEDVVVTALAKSKDERFPSASEFAHALAEVPEAALRTVSTELRAQNTRARSIVEPLPEQPGDAPDEPASSSEDTYALPDAASSSEDTYALPDAATPPAEPAGDARDQPVADAPAEPAAITPRAAKRTSRRSRGKGVDISLADTLELQAILAGDESAPEATEQTPPAAQHEPAQESAPDPGADATEKTPPVADPPDSDAAPRGKPAALGSYERADATTPSPSPFVVVEDETEAEEASRPPGVTLPHTLETSPVPRVPAEKRSGAALALLLLPLGLAAAVWYGLRQSESSNARPPAATTPADPAATTTLQPSPAAIPNDAAPAPTSPDETTKPKPKPKSKPIKVKRVKDVEALIRQKRTDEAIRGIKHLLRTTHKDNAYLYLLLGDQCFVKKWWDDGIYAYRNALKRNRKYRTRATLNKNAIRALVYDKIRVSINNLFLKYIGKAGLPYLRKAAKSDPSKTIRHRAGWLVGQLTKKGR